MERATERHETPEAMAAGPPTEETKTLENEKRGCCSKQQKEGEVCCNRPSASCCSITIMTCCRTAKKDSMGVQTSPKTSCLQLPRKCVDLCQQGCCVTILCDGIRKKICLSVNCSMTDANKRKCCGEPMGCCKCPGTPSGCCKKSNATVVTKSAPSCRCGSCCGGNTKRTAAEAGCSMKECCTSLGSENADGSSETKEECSMQNCSERCNAGCCVSQKSNEKSIDPVSCCACAEGCKKEECTKSCCKESIICSGNSGKSEDDTNREDEINSSSNSEKPCRCSTVSQLHEILEQCNCDNQGNDKCKCKKPCCLSKCPIEGKIQKDCTNEPKENCCQCKRLDETGESNDSNCCCKTRTNEGCCSAGGNGIIFITGGCYYGVSKRVVDSKLTCCDASCAKKDSQKPKKICDCKTDDFKVCDCKCDEECTCESAKDRGNCCNSKTALKIILVDCKDRCCSATDNVGVKGCNDESMNVKCCRVFVKFCPCFNRSSDEDYSCREDCCRTCADNDCATRENCCVTFSDCLCSGKCCTADRIRNCSNLEVLCCCIRKQGCCNSVKSVEDESPIKMDCHCRTARCGDNCTCYGYKKTHIISCCCYFSLMVGCCTINIKSCCNCCSCKKTCCVASSSVQALCQTEKSCCCISANNKSDDPCGCEGGKPSDCCTLSRASGCCKA